MVSTGNEHYDAILARVDELQEEDRRARPFPPSVPANFTVDLGAYRMTVAFERIDSQKAA